MTETLDAAELLARSAERDIYEDRIAAAWRDGYDLGFSAGVEAGRRQAAAEEAAQRAEAAGFVHAGPASDELQRRRWSVRSEARSRETFAQPHPDDYQGGRDPRPGDYPGQKASAA